MSCPRVFGLWLSVFLGVAAGAACGLGAESATFRLDAASGVKDAVSGARPSTPGSLKAGKMGGVAVLTGGGDAGARYALPKGAADAGTAVVRFVPGPAWLTKKAPDILFQIGGHHYAPNSFTLIREPDNRLVFMFHGNGSQKTVFPLPADGFAAGQTHTVAYAWDGASIEVYAHGKHQKRLPGVRLSPEALKPDMLSVGGPYHAKADWAFSGGIAGVEILPRKLSAAEALALVSGSAASKPGEARAVAGVPPLTREGVYAVETDGVVRVGTPTLELQCSPDGQPLALYDKLGKRFVIADWKTGGGLFWMFTHPGDAKRSLGNRTVPGRVELSDGAARFVHALPDADGGEMRVEVRPDADGALRFRYTLTNPYAGEIGKVYFPYFAGIDKDSGGWAFQSRWNGVKRDLRNFKFLCYGGPGHLSMLVSGVKAGKTLLLLYPEDKKGAVKFAVHDDRNSGPDGHVNMTWENRDHVQPGETFSPPYDFVLHNLGDADLAAMAGHYRKWAERQDWFVTFAEKSRAKPALRQVMNGVVKMGGMEVSPRGRREKWAPRAYKDAHEKILTYDYNRFLQVARRIEEWYGIRPAYRYDGWWGRFDSLYPDYFPVDAAMGDFGDFMRQNTADGRMVYFHTNPIQYDEDAPSFAFDKMSRTTDKGDFSVALWNRNRLYFASPSLARADGVRAVEEMRRHGVRGIFEDVIGCTTMLDFNPSAGYPARARDGGTAALTELCRALSVASGDAFRATEGGEERRMPHYDAFMLGAGSKREEVPFFWMVYGDCVVNATGIAGGALDPAQLGRRMVFGQIMGLDGRQAWAKDRYDAWAQLYFETVAATNRVAGRRMTDFRDDGDVWVSRWDGDAAFANLSPEPVAEFRHGPFVLRGLEGYASVFVGANGDFAAWNCREVEKDGVAVFRMEKTGGDAALVKSGGRLALAAVRPGSVAGKRVEPGDRPGEITMTRLEVAGRAVKGTALRRPQRDTVPLDFSAPAALPVDVAYYLE